MLDNGSVCGNCGAWDKCFDDENELNIARVNRYFDMYRVLEMLADADYGDSMTERAYRDVIAPGIYSLQSFVARVDEEIEKAANTEEEAVHGIMPRQPAGESGDKPSAVTIAPRRMDLRSPNPVWETAHWILPCYRNRPRLALNPT